MKKERWVLLTGASGGIGASIALQLAQEGCHLFLHYRQGKEDVERIKSRCQELGVHAYILQADLKEESQVEELVASLPRKPDILINNAGLTHYGLFTDTSKEDLDRLYKVNVKAPYLLCQRIVPHMVRNQSGRIINVSSIWGLTGASCEVLYSMTKGALLAFTKALAKELAPSQITVNAVVPGAVEGKLMDRQFSIEDQESIAQEIPMGRLGTPEEIASLVCYLLRPEAQYITGQVISPNGGWYT